VASLLALFLKRQRVEHPRIVELSAYIREGAGAFLRREFKALTVFTIVMAGVLALFLGGPVALAYVLGTLVSALAGWVGMAVATRANARAAQAVITSYAMALRVSLYGGAVMGFFTVGVGIGGLTLLFLVTENFKIWLSYAFGASLVALFLRVGGGIYTKSADVGADLAGKVEAGIPEDDPRNPAVIADLVGDNVGDVAGMGSDLYESYISAIAATMVLGFVAYGALGAILALLLGAAGVAASILGLLALRFPEVRGSYELQASKARAVMNRSVYVSTVAMAVLAYFVITGLFGSQGIGLFYALLTGLLGGFLIGLVTQYFTAEYKPVLAIARASETGSGTTIIEGLAMGMFSTAPPILIVAGATLLSVQAAGLLGIAVASLGMLATLATLLSMDAYGPIADNAAGLAEMAGLGPEVRQRAEALDAAGNTTAAIGKGFAIASAALASLAWISTYFEIANLSVVSITEAPVVVGLMMGAMLVFIFSALAMRAVGKTEVRRQWREIPGLREGKAKADYVKCVDISTRHAIRSIIPSGLLVLLVPVLVGLLLGPAALAGTLLGVLITGFSVSVMMANAGGAWDNAKKYIEAGHFGGKGSEAHKAAVVGDTVGDPFKDTAGPSLNILIKLVGKIAVMFAPLFLLFA